MKKIKKNVLIGLILIGIILAVVIIIVSIKFPGQAIIGYWDENGISFSNNIVSVPYSFELRAGGDDFCYEFSNDGGYDQNIADLKAKLGEDNYNEFISMLPYQESMECEKNTGTGWYTVFGCVVKLYSDLRLCFVGGTADDYKVSGVFQFDVSPQSQEINVYRYLFEDNICILVTILEDERLSNDYDTLEECEAIILDDDNGGEEGISYLIQILIAIPVILIISLLIFFIVKKRGKRRKKR